MSKLSDISINANVSLAACSTIGIGGNARYYYEPVDENEIFELMRFASENGISCRVIGRGSNIVFDDGGYDGVIVKLGKNFSNTVFIKTIVIAEAGLYAPKLAFDVARRGLEGIEHTVGIPGSVGGLVYMNGGSNKRSIGESVLFVRAMMPNGNVKLFSREECCFSYRSSLFQKNHAIILSVALELREVGSEKLIPVLLNTLRKRRERFPLTLRNCGSVFKTDKAYFDTLGSAGIIIDELGLKGFRVGDACVSDRHANFIVNLGHATSSDFYAVVNHIAAQVYVDRGIHLEMEVKHVGNLYDMLGLSS